MTTPRRVPGRFVGEDVDQVFGVFLAGTFFAVALAFVALTFGAADLAGAFAAALAAGDSVVVSTDAFAAASARAVFDSAARALPAAVWAPFALSARPAAMRDFAAFAAWALLVCFVTRPDV